MRLPKAGGTPVRVTPFLGYTYVTVLGFAVDATYVYWADCNSHNVNRMLKTGSF
jgi:hypothetical protein